MVGGDRAKRSRRGNAVADEAAGGIVQFVGTGNAGRMGDSGLTARRPRMLEKVHRKKV